MASKQSKQTEERTVIRMRQFGTMKLEQAERAVQYLNQKENTTEYEVKNRFRDRWIIIRVLPVCSLQCVTAHGDDCNCHCSGKHHQEGLPVAAA